MLSGSCHCEKVKWSYDRQLESVTACNCTLCRRYGALWAYGYLEQGVAVSGKTSAYARGREINGFHFCSDCGCLTHYMANSPDEEGRIRIAVNMRMAQEPEKIAALPIDHFDGYDLFEDLPQDGRCVRDLWF